MFNGTIKENILLGNKDISEERINEIISLVCLDEDIKNMPNGINTIIGDNGTTLSGGQEQKVALARIFVKDYSIIILDEPTSALDIESEEIISKVLSVCLSTGGDFAEIFQEDCISNSILVLDNKVENALGGRNYGIGIRIFKGVKSVYAYTNENSLTNLLDIAYEAAVVLGTLKKDDISVVLNDKLKYDNLHSIRYYPSAIGYNKKIEKMKEAYDAAKDFHNEIAQVKVGYKDQDQKILVANSEGAFVEDRRIRTRLSIKVVASDGNLNQTAFEGPGAHKGFEIFNNLDPAYYGREAARSAHLMLHARNCPSGNMTVAIDNGFGGVLFHEACGHSIEATAVSKGNSIFAGKFGKQIASEKITAIDDGTIANEWASSNIDDEGVPTKKNILIENGILKSYMVDKLNSRRMNMNVTGNSRIENYRYAPTSRMTNTYIAPGNSTKEEIIASISEGLYAKKLGGGSVNPVTGEFNFSVQEGYIVKNGVIQEPVRGASIMCFHFRKYSSRCRTTNYKGKKHDCWRQIKGRLWNLLSLKIPYLKRQKVKDLRNVKYILLREKRWEYLYMNKK